MYMQGGKSKIGAVKRILVEEGAKKQVWGDSDGEPQRELREDDVGQIRRRSPQDREVVSRL